MTLSDSKYLLLLPLLCGLGACTAQTSAMVSNTDALDLAIIEENIDRLPLTQIEHFRVLCLSGPHETKAKTDRASSLGWQAASDEALAQAGLQRLRKQVLSIPGGGARFSETQEILALPSPDGAFILNLENRIAGSQLRSSQCALYSKSDYFKTCEAVGRLIGKAPSRNQAYRDKDAHFIQWNTIADDKEAIVSCSRAPQSAILPYDGTVISLLIDHIGTARKTAFKPLRPGNNQGFPGGSQR